MDPRALPQVTGFGDLQVADFKLSCCILTQQKHLRSCIPGGCVFAAALGALCFWEAGLLPASFGGPGGEC